MLGHYIFFFHLIPVFFCDEKITVKEEDEEEEMKRNQFISALHDNSIIGQT